MGHHRDTRIGMGLFWGGYFFKYDFNAIIYFLFVLYLYAIWYVYQPYLLYRVFENNSNTQPILTEMLYTDVTNFSTE